MTVKLEGWKHPYSRAFCAPARPFRTGVRRLSKKQGQGHTKRKLPKNKHEKESWKKRNENRLVKQFDHRDRLLTAEIEAQQWTVNDEPVTLLTEPVRTSDYYRATDDPLFAFATEVHNENLRVRSKYGK